MALKAKHWTISAASVEVGRDKRTVGGLLADIDPIRVDGKSSYYLMKDIVDAIAGDKNKINPADEATQVSG